jgi:hypothetical protein
LAGGKIAPLIVPAEMTEGTGLMNPSIFVDDDGDVLVNVRHVNYIFYHSEHKQRFPAHWGPLSYLHPENKMVLATTNFLCKLGDDLQVEKIAKVDMALDIPPVWEFVGLEDARLVKWEGEYFLCGVRRDCVPEQTGQPGEGRMEYTKINLDKEAWTATEVMRKRIPAPGADNGYCEKNWMPVLDKPYNFIKWTMPTQLVESFPYNETMTCEEVFVKDCLPAPADQRGGSQIVRWGDYYLTFTHEVNLWYNYLSQKDATYRHRLVVWDTDFNFLGLSPQPLTFLDAYVEFCTGAALYKGDLLVSFGYQDNAAFALQMPKSIVDELITEALTYGK